MSGYVESTGAQPVELKGMSPTRLIALLMFTQVPAVLGYTIALPLLAVMSTELAHDAAGEFLVKMISGILGPAMALGSLIAGLLADRYGRRMLVLGIGAVYLVVAVAPAFLTDLNLIVASRAALGFCGAAIAAIGFTMAGDYLPEDRRAKVIGMLSAFGLIASLASMKLAGIAGQWGWRTAFMLYLLAAPVLLLALPSALPAPAKAATGPATTTAGPWHSGIPWGLLAIALCTGMILAIPGIYSSYHLATIGLGKPDTVANIMMLNAAAGAVASVLFGKALEKSSKRLVFSVSYALMGLGLAIYAFAHGLGPVLLAMVLMGATLGILSPGMPALAVESAPEGKRGKIVGLVQGVGALASIVGLALLEPLMPRYGTSGVMLAIAALSAVLILPFAFRRKA